MAERFARIVVGARVAIVTGWIAVAVTAALLLPSLEEAQTGALGDLVPIGAEAIEAEQRSAELFLFPFSSRTVVVQRDPDGLTTEQLVRTAARVTEVNRNVLPELRDAAGAYGITNAIPGLSFAREDGTTAVSALLFNLDIGQVGRTRRAENFMEALGSSPGTFAGVTGVIPARAAQAEAIRDRLPLVEIVTLLFIALTVGVYLRSAVAPVVTLATVAVAYIVSVRLVAVLGAAVDISVPAEVEPVVVALLFGIVTDYALFFMSRFRSLVADGASGRDAGRRTTAELTPIVFTCGIAVAAGSAALAVADLGFLKAFGPGMALAVLIGLLVVLTMLPATLALLGARLFWPSTPQRQPARRGRPRVERLIRFAVERPKTTVAASLAVIAAMGAGTAWLELGNPVIRGLSADAEARVAYEQLSEGFAPGVVAPTTLIVEGEDIVQERAALSSLQAVLEDQPGIAGVLGPATQPAQRPFGAVLSQTGDAARYVLFTETDPLGADAIRRLGNLRARIGDLAEAVGLEDARASFAGDTALVSEIIDTANGDLAEVVPAVLIVVALVLALFLRAIAAPIYLVLLAALAPLASVGLAVVVFQGIFGYPELTYYVPIVAAVLLVSLGSDYNVFVAGSIWAQLRHRPLREAIVAGGGDAAHAIAAAGIVLAASFAALALVPVRAFQELAFVLAVGLLIDAFLIRLVLAPAVILLAGRRRARANTAH